MQRRVRIWLILALISGTVSCEPDDAAPPRPEGVPADAVWAGGMKGGDWLRCVAESEEQFLCTVYSESSGHVIARGTFLLRGIEHDSVDHSRRLHKVEIWPDSLEFIGYDGDWIYLRDDQALVPHGWIAHPFAENWGKRVLYHVGRLIGDEVTYGSAPYDSQRASFAEFTERRAGLLTGCYEVAWPTGVDPDSLVLSRRLELTSRSFGVLGYHRLFYFETDMPAANSHAHANPIWTPITEDSLEIDLQPLPYTEPHYQVVLSVREDSLLVGELRKVTFRADGTRYPPIRTVVVAGTVTGRRVSCEAR
jgi:hypothetical protein